MDLGCKLIRGEWAPGRATIPVPVFVPGSLYRDFFYIFIFCLRGMGLGEEGVGQRRVGGVVCRLLCVQLAPPLMLSQCFLSLSLELVLRYRPGTLAHPMPGGPEEDRPLRPCPPWRGHQHRSPPPATCPPHHRLLLPSPPGPQCSGLGELCRDCAPPSAPHARNAAAKPPPRPRRHCALRTPEAIAGPRPGRLVRSCIKLSPCPSSLHPRVSSVFFSFPPSSSCSPPFFGSAQVKRLPSLPCLHGSPAHVMFPSLFFLCVFI